MNLMNRGAKEALNDIKHDIGACRNAFFHLGLITHNILQMDEVRSLKFFHNFFNDLESQNNVVVN